MEAFLQDLWDASWLGCRHKFIIFTVTEKQRGDISRLNVSIVTICLKQYHKNSYKLNNNIIILFIYITPLHTFKCSSRCCVIRNPIVYGQLNRQEAGSRPTSCLLFHHPPNIEWKISKNVSVYPPGLHWSIASSQCSPIAEW